MTLIKPKYTPEDFATVCKDEAEAAHRYRSAQARALLDSPIVAVNRLPCYHVEMEDGTYRDIPIGDVHPRTGKANR